MRDSILEASYIYPTHGDQLLELAANILDGKPYSKETKLMSAIVTRENANVLLMQNEEIVRQSEYVDQLHTMSDGYLQQLDTQRVINWMAIGIIFLLLIAIVLFYRYHLNKVAMQHERIVDTLWNMKPEDIEIPQSENNTQSEDLSPEGNTAEEEPETVSTAASSLFITRFKEVVEARMADSEVSVEDLAADMNLSRVQLYRKVKAVTGSSPVELLRTARLKRAYQLLATSSKNVSEVAYEVGFTAPSYFTKCFKDEFGISPSDL